MSRESLFPQNVETKLHCTIEPDLLNRNRPEDSYLMQGMFCTINTKYVTLAKCWLTCSVVKEQIKVLLM